MEDTIRWVLLKRSSLQHCTASGIYTLCGLDVNERTSNCMSLRHDKPSRCPICSNNLNHLGDIKDDKASS